MHAMAEWYMRGEQYDQAKLSRILDVAQDLKVSLKGQSNALFIDDKNSTCLRNKSHVTIS